MILFLFTKDYGRDGQHHRTTLLLRAFSATAIFFPFPGLRPWAVLKRSFAAEGDGANAFAAKFDPRERTTIE